MDFIGRGLGKGALLAISLLCNGAFLAATYQYPLELIAHYKEILMGSYTVAEVPAALYTAFLIWGVVWLVISPSGHGSDAPMGDEV